MPHLSSDDLHWLETKLAREIQWRHSWNFADSLNKSGSLSNSNLSIRTPGRWLSLAPFLRADTSLVCPVGQLRWVWLHLSGCSLPERPVWISPRETLCTAMVANLVLSSACGFYSSSWWSDSSKAWQPLRGNANGPTVFAFIVACWDMWSLLLNRGKTTNSCCDYCNLLMKWLLNYSGNIRVGHPCYHHSEAGNMSSVFAPSGAP